MRWVYYCSFNWPISKELSGVCLTFGSKKLTWSGPLGQEDFSNIAVVMVICRQYPVHSLLPDSNISSSIRRWQSDYFINESTKNHRNSPHSAPQSGRPKLFIIARVKDFSLTFSVINQLKLLGRGTSGCAYFAETLHSGMYKLIDVYEYLQHKRTSVLCYTQGQWSHKHIICGSM